MSSKAFSLLAAPAVVLLAGCNTVHSEAGQNDFSLGESVAYAKAAHTINPDPVYTEDAAKPGYHGEKGAQATRRYRTDQVKSVEVQSTTSAGGGPR